MYFVTTDQIHFYSSIKSEICNIQELIITNAVQTRMRAQLPVYFLWMQNDKMNVRKEDEEYKIMMRR